MRVLRVFSGTILSCRELSRRDYAIGKAEPENEPPRMNKKKKGNRRNTRLTGRRRNKLNLKNKLNYKEEADRKVKEEKKEIQRIERKAT